MNKKILAGISILVSLILLSAVVLLITKSNSGAIINEEDKEVDLLPDYVEALYGTDTEKADTDGDGLTDYQEAYFSDTNPLDSDTDNDGIVDEEEETMTPEEEEASEHDLNENVVGIEWKYRTPEHIWHGVDLSCDCWFYCYEKTADAPSRTVTIEWIWEECTGTERIASNYEEVLCFSSDYLISGTVGSSCSLVRKD